MRFEEIQIPAFGPFCDFELAFPKTKYDVHLIYGRNEAGKSSLLRAIRGLLYGIPAKSADNFRHTHAKMRIGATISNASGELTFSRRKGNKNTLLDHEGNALADEVLAPFLDAVNEDFFVQMFGLNTDSLRAGAIQLLSGEGDLGATLFMASQGGSAIEAAIRSLEEEAGQLYRGRARKDVTILPALERMKEAEKAEKVVTTTAAAWEELKGELARARAKVAPIEKRERDQRGRRSSLEKCLSALPILATLERLEAGLAGITLPRLPSDFSTRVRAASAEEVAKGQELKLKLAQEKNLRERLGKLGDFSAVLARAGDFDELRRRADLYQESLLKLPELERALTIRELAQLPLVKAADKARFKELATELQSLKRREGELRRDLANVEIALKADLAEATRVDLADLEEKVRVLSEFAPRQASQANLERQLVENEKAIQVLVLRLEIEGDARELAVPGVREIQGAQREEERLTDVGREVRAELRGVQRDLAQQEARLAQLQGEVALYAPKDLAEAREKRDGIWKEILVTAKPQAELGEAISHADRVADSLREQADQLAQAMGCRAKIAELEARGKLLEEQMVEAVSDYERWREQWFARSRQKSPQQLLDWRGEWESLCELLEERDQRRGELKEIRGEEVRLLSEFEAGSFSELFVGARKALKEALQEEGARQDRAERRAKAQVRGEQAARELGEVEEALQERVPRWVALCEKAGLPEELAPEAAVEAMLERERAREVLVDYLAGEKTVADYERLLKELGGAFAVEASEVALSALYEQARSEERRKSELSEELAKLEDEKPALEAGEKAAQAALADLRKQAQGDDLEEVLREIEERAKLEEQREGQRELLQRLAGRASLEDFVAGLRDLDEAELEREREELAEVEEAIQQERDEARRELEELVRREAELLEASDVAAAEKQAAADAFSAVVADTVRFRQLHYAIAFLKEQVEAYRKMAQGPMIERTSEYFRELTEGAFSRVAAQLDDKDRPKLVAVRAEGEGEEMVETMGLSEGTADQLYLALRLAAISLHLENHTAMPLILDDVLMTFDDVRTQALMRVLQKLSTQTQVLIFTHHAHLKDLVGREVQIHELEPEVS